MELRAKDATILIVDDDKANLSILRATFADAGFKVLTARSAEEAQALLSSAQDAATPPVHLVLTDIQMPGASGFDLVTWMKSRPSPLKDIPVLLITSQLPEPEHRVLGLSLGAVDYLLRSLDPQEIVMRVANAIANFRQVQGLQARLQDSESLAMVGRLLAAANHEVKNVAAMVSATAQLLEGFAAKLVSGDESPEMQALRGLRSSIDLLLSVTRSTSRLVGDQRLELVPLDLQKVVAAVCAMVKPAFRGVYVGQEISGASWVMAGETQLKQLIINLLLNAREAVDEMKPVEGGRIIVTARETDENVELIVTDNGVGFPAAGKRDTFAPFATTKQLRGGQGLGLWLCSRFAETMRGKLTLASGGPGLGAEAVLTLTKAQNAPPELIDISAYLD